MALMGRRFQTVAALDMSGYTWPAEDGTSMAEALAVAFPCLREVRFEACVGVTNEFVHALVGRLPRIVSVDMSSCTQVTDTAVASIAHHCHGLVSFNASGCHRITDDGDNGAALLSACKSDGERLQTVDECDAHDAGIGM